MQLLVLFSVLILLHEILFVLASYLRCIKTQDAVVFQGVDRNEFKCLADWAPVLRKMSRHDQPCQKAFRLQLPKTLRCRSWPTSRWSVIQAGHKSE